MTDLAPAATAAQQAPLPHTAATAIAAPARELVDGRLATPSIELPAVLADPDDGTVRGPQRASDPEAVERALAAAFGAWDGGAWSGLAIEARAAALERWAAEVERRQEAVAALDAVESGVPLTVTAAVAGALGGVIRGVAARAVGAGQRRVLPAGGRRVEVLRLPWGPAVVLGPWNAPAATAAGKLANALAAGCPVVLKPSEFAPGSAGLLAEAAVAAGLPAGAVQVVHGGAEVAGRLAGDDRVRCVVLTGSQAAGRAVAALAAPRMAALQLELGGANAALVLPDADRTRTADALVQGMTKLNGQWCEAPRRVIVVGADPAGLVEALLARLARVVVGSWRAAGTDVGPLAHRAHRDRVLAQLARLGGRAIAPAAVAAGPGFHLAPTVVLGADPVAAGEEIFGPVLSVHRAPDERAAIALANQPGDGLAGYVFGGDRDRAFAVAARLHAGEVRIGGTKLLDLAPGSTQSFWGSSGIGGHGDREAFEAFRGSRIVGEDDPALPI